MVLTGVFKYAVPVVLGLLLAVASLLWGGQAAVIAGVASILLTATLVSITWYYADETRILRREAQVTRLFNQPVIRLTATLASEPHVVLRNIGQGFAADVSIAITETSDAKEPMLHSLAIPILGPGEGVEFTPHSHVFRSINGFLLDGRSISFSAGGQYTDASGTKHSIDDVFSLSDFINSCEQLGVEFARDDSFKASLRDSDEREYRKAVTGQLTRVADAITRIRL